MHLVTESANRRVERIRITFDSASNISAKSAKIEILLSQIMLTPR